MKTNEDLKYKVLMAARDNGISSILFRNALAKRFGLNLTESLCLTLLGIKQVSTPTELAKYTGLTTGSTTTMLDRLEKKKIITRKPNPKDRRGVIIEINKAYAKTASKLVEGIQAAHHKLIESYSEKELVIIADFLRRFTDNIAEHTKRIEEETQ
jgi:DNA-binding MarR family transcriptional regulator